MMNDAAKMLRTAWEASGTAQEWDRRWLDDLPANVRRQAEESPRHVEGVAQAKAAEAIAVCARALVSGRPPTLTEVRAVAEAAAWSNEAHCAALRAAVTRADYSHATHRPHCGRSLLCVYRIDPASPTQCDLVATADADDPCVQEILAQAGRAVGQAGTRGARACAAGMGK